MKRKLNHLFWILPLGFLLRLYHLGSRSFWYDEAISMLAVRDFNLENIRNYGAFFTDAPLFYAFLKGWSFFGEGEFFLRILPMFFGCLSIIAVYYLAKLLFDPKTAIISSFILAVAPFHIYYSQELRVYTMVAFLALISMYYFVWLTKKSSLGNSIGYIVSTVLVLLSHHFAVCLLVGQLVSSFILGYRNKFFLKRSLVSQALIILFVSTVYFSLGAATVVIDQVSKVRGSDIFYWLPKVSLITLSHSLRVFTVGYNCNHLIASIATLTFVFIISQSFFYLKARGKEIVILLPWLIVPVLVAFCVSKNLNRLFVYASPAYYLLVAFALTKVSKKIKGIFFFVFLFSVFLSLNSYYRNIFPMAVNPWRPGIFIKKDNKKVAGYIADNYRGSDLVLHVSRSTLGPFLYYNDRKLNEKWVADHLSLDWQVWKRFLPENISERNRLLEPFIAVDANDLKFSDYKRFWLVFAGWDFFGRESISVKETLDKNFQLLGQKDFEGIEVYLYGNF